MNEKDWWEDILLSLVCCLAIEGSHERNGTILFAWMFFIGYMTWLTMENISYRPKQSQYSHPVMTLSSIRNLF